MVGAIDRTLPEAAGADPVVRPSERADFQSNAALALAKRAERRPAGLAAAVADEVRGTADSAVVGVEVSGPGFVNLTVADAAIWGQVAARLVGSRLGIGAPERGQRTVIDYSGPSIAKEMHVGHLRTTIIGDALARILSFLGAEVIRQNHLGDWGTKFGMLIQYLDEHPDAAWHRDQLAAGTSTVSALDGLYKAARREFDADAAFAGPAPGWSPCRPGTRRPSPGGGKSSPSPSSRSGRSTIGSGCCWSRAIRPGSRPTTTSSRMSLPS